MKTHVNFTDFCDRFAMMDRKDNFTYEGLQALFNYLEQLEQDIEQEIELDVIALCCDYTEYDSLEDCLAEYDSISTREELEDRTTVIDVEGGGIIIQNF